MAAKVAAKVDRARHAAVRDAVTVIDTDGAARLVYRDGAYQLRHRRLVLPPETSTETDESATSTTEQAGSSARRRVAASDTEGAAPATADTGAPVNRETAAVARTGTDAPTRATTPETGAEAESDGEATVVLPVIQPVTVLEVEETVEETLALVESEAGTTKLAQAEALLVQAWERGEEPTLSEIDRLIGGSRTATNAKRSLRERGVSCPPPSAPPPATGRRVVVPGWRA